MNVSSWLERAKTKIDILDAELILLNALFGDDDADRTWLVTHQDDILSVQNVEKANCGLARRQRKEPLAYILGWKEFYGHKFIVKDAEHKVLVPRVESESLVELIKGLNFDAETKILDVGTGSGCVALSLALEIPNAKVLAVDIDEAAKVIFGKNAQKMGLDGKVLFVKSNLLSDIKNFERQNVIVANLPYVDRSWNWLDRASLDYEPENALYADENGLALIKRLIQQVANLQGADYLVLEADPCQHNEIEKYAESCGFRHIETRGFSLCFSCLDKLPE